ncbi:MAG: helix-turn-helix domain-containing protein [Patescibacteria group bacterium]
MSENSGNFENALVNLGLNAKEASGYVALLGLGQATVSEIAKKAGINRTTVYDILSSLGSKGLVSISGKEPKQEYRAENPDKLITYLKNDLELKAQNVRYAELILPELKSIHKIGERPRIKFYEGEDGLREVYEDTLTSEGTILAYAAVDDVHKGIVNYFPKYYKRRAAKNIPIRAIFPDTAIARERSNLDKEEKRESLLVPFEKYSFTPEINIYNNKVMIASWREKLGIIIESAEIADAMKKIFELSWDRAKELDKEMRQ